MDANALYVIILWFFYYYILKDITHMFPMTLKPVVRVHI